VSERTPQARVLVVAGLFGGVLALLAARAAELTVLRGPELAQEAAGQHERRIELVPHRGPIVGRTGETLALSLDVESVYVRPRLFAGEEAHMPALAAALGMPVATVREKTASRQPFVWLKRQVMPREAEAVVRLGLRGVGSLAEGRRFYPLGSLAAHVLGFVGVDSQGLAGLELRLDEAIRGRPRWVWADRDAKGRELLVGGVQEPAEHGSRVELTLDATIQEATERELAAGVQNAQAVGGVAIVLDPTTGEVLALANYPTFDPNLLGATRDRHWRDRVRNRALTDPYEPGSTFKAFLASAAIEEGVVSPADRLFCENGAYRVGKWTINDAHPHGWLTFAEVIQYSSNIGATKVADRLGRERYFHYLEAFGFGARSGSELPGESPGIMRPVEEWARIDLAVHSFGQGVAVTPLQMVAGFGAIANGGVLMRPYVVKRIVSPSGEVTRETSPTAVRRVVSERTAHTVTALLRRVVEEKGGTGTKARLEDFPVAGKTGTAQKVDLRSGGYSSKRIGSFVGFVPADRPRAVILVLIDEPTTSSYGGVVAAPVFRAIAQTVLQRLDVAPVTPPIETAAALRPRAPSPTRAAQPALAAEPPATGMPSFIGLSLREAVVRARAAGFAVETSGTGYVMHQEPLPGTPLDGHHRLVLTLAPGEILASP